MKGSPQEYERVPAGPLFFCMQDGACMSKLCRARKQRALVEVRTRSQRAHVLFERARNALLSPQGYPLYICLVANMQFISFKQKF